MTVNILMGFDAGVGQACALQGTLPTNEFVRSSRGCEPGHKQQKRSLVGDQIHNKTHQEYPKKNCKTHPENL